MQSVNKSQNKIGKNYKKRNIKKLTTTKKKKKEFKVGFLNYFKQVD